ncbi:hypothetical protein RHMOL_Rhmol07G0160700 [Rhododendron molle]|uniref:Uncharacterized protein n=3 Tax=Rhododendron molle TaxID=49168 RepID=A0ACC0N2A9_RHOML|nr:hypothetical protein RHMOL_Rhmol07G0160700 [Rhododendron molle]KAI8546968.1 hypothetical protein RHMOL_Rhmol07G0160700 [Rhododendron molle]KAI8546969.1 hypothetical protein RHMOL_Rhmol07G0160700 [Rhododendron molle]
MHTRIHITEDVKYPKALPRHGCPHSSIGLRANKLFAWASSPPASFATAIHQMHVSGLPWWAIRSFRILHCACFMMAVRAFPCRYPVPLVVVVRCKSLILDLSDNRKWGLRGRETIAIYLTDGFAYDSDCPVSTKRRRKYKMAKKVDDLCGGKVHEDHQPKHMLFILHQNSGIEPLVAAIQTMKFNHEAFSSMKDAHMNFFSIFMLFGLESRRRYPKNKLCGSEKTASNNLDLVLKYRWFVGERTPSNFIAIPEATRVVMFSDCKVYLPKHEDIGRILKVECTPVLDGTEYPTRFTISSRVSPGMFFSVLKIDVRGELMEGNTISGYAEVAWCGGTPRKGVASPVVIAGAEDEQYQLTLDDIDSCLVFVYTLVTEEGVKGEPQRPQYAITDTVKAVRLLKEVPSKVLDNTLEEEGVGANLSGCVRIGTTGQEGESVSTISKIVKQAFPKLTNLKVIGDIREGIKVTVTGTVTGGTEASSRVQWFKLTYSTVENENGLDALGTSKIAKAFRIPLGAVGYFIVAKFTPMTPNGESGESAYVKSS